MLATLPQDKKKNKSHARKTTNRIVILAFSPRI